MTELYDIVEESHFVEPVQTVPDLSLIIALLVLVVVIVAAVLLALRRRRRGKK